MSEQRKENNSDRPLGFDESTWAMLCEMERVAEEKNREALDEIARKDVEEAKREREDGSEVRDDIFCDGTPGPFGKAT